MQHDTIADDFRLLVSHIEGQSQELAILFRRLETDPVLETVQRRQKQLVLTTISTLQESISAILVEREEELARINSRSIELHAGLQFFKEERDAWRAVALANDSALRAMFRAEHQSESCISSARVPELEDGVSFAAIPNEGPEMEETPHLRHACKLCGSKDACMLFLPCRHVCSCEPCDALLEDCLVCGAPRQASIEVFFD